MYVYFEKNIYVCKKKKKKNVAEASQIKVESLLEGLLEFVDFITGGQFDEYRKDKRRKEKKLSLLQDNVTSATNKLVSLERQKD